MEARAKSYPICETTSSTTRKAEMPRYGRTLYPPPKLPNSVARKAAQIRSLLVHRYYAL